MNPANGRKLVWSDDFEGNKLDTSKWAFTRAMQNGDVFYDNGENCVTVADSKIHLASFRGKFGDKDYTLPESLTTLGKMYFKYGYIEMKASLPFTNGAWPSFWMKTNTPYKKAEYMAEIDILENFSKSDEVVSNLHKWGAEGKHSMLDWQIYKGYRFKNPENLNNEYHIYALEWTKEEMRFFVDGENYYSYKIDDANDFDTEIMPGMQGFHDFAYLLMNNEIFSPAIQQIMPQFKLNADDKMPDYYIDYVRLYQKDGEEIIIEK